ncbi:beta-lactamase family protein [Candidatus Poribacteria bacterium]|nr:beta-lactamase family protein [Candidatus Poribacteria bacterium]
MEIYGGLPRAVPENVGMSTSRLERIAPVMQGYVDNGKIPCALTMIARRGKLVHFEKCGMQDIAAAKPIEYDTIFRIYSMTKPITSIAVMMLYEEGHFQLGTPVSKFIPAFKDMQVYTENEEGTVAAEREITIKHLLTHTAGFTYGGESDHPIAQRYEDIFSNVYALAKKIDLAREMEELGKIPLFFNPVPDGTTGGHPKWSAASSKRYPVCHLPNF